MKGFLPWLGGKSQLASMIIGYIKQIDHMCYIEPFCGAAHVFFCKEPSKVEVLNDINSDLTTLFRVLQNHLEEFLRYFKWILVSREEFERINSQNPESLTDIQRAARFYYLQKLSFGGKVTGRSFGTSTTSPPRLNLLRIEEELSQVHLRLSRVFIERLSYQKAIEKYDRKHTLLYLDPPYNGHENDYGTGLFTKDDFDTLSSILSSIEGRFILSLNGTKPVRKIFKRYYMKSVSVRYSVGRNEKSKKHPELLISSIDLENLPDRS